MMQKALERWRSAKKAIEKAQTYENAVELQVAQRSLRVAQRDNLTLVKGGKE